MSRVRHVISAVVTAVGLVTAAVANDIAKWDPRMAAEQGVVDTNGVKWIDGKALPIEGRAFDDVEAYYHRLPKNVTTNVNEGVRWMKRHTSGMQFRFITDSRKIRVRWTPLKQQYAGDNMSWIGSAGIDAYRREADGTWRFVKTARLSTKRKEWSFEFDWKPGEPCLLNLPNYEGVRQIAVGIDAQASIMAPPPHARVRKPVVFYGTSITHGASASRPGLAFVNVIGRELDVPVVNLGFSGSGRMEFEMSEHLARIDASCYVLDCLWNMGLGWICERYEPFIRNLRAKRPGVPIVMAEQSDVFYRPGQNENRFKKSNDFVRALFEKLVAEGWQNLVYLPSEGMYSGDGEGTIDTVHPNDLGMRTMATAYGKAVKEALGL